MPINTTRAKTGMKRVFKRGTKGTKTPTSQLNQKGLQKPSAPLGVRLRALRSPVKRTTARKPTTGLRFNKSGRKTKVVS